MTAKVIRSWLARLGTRTLYIEPGMRQLCRSWGGFGAAAPSTGWSLLQPPRLD